MHGRTYGTDKSSSTVNRDDGPTVTVVSGKTEAVSYRMDVASSAELLSSLIITDDRATPVSSNVAHTRILVMDADAATVEANTSP